MTENLTILKKGLILVAIPFVIQLLFIAVLYRTNVQASRARSLALQSKHVITNTDAVYRKLIETQSSIRALLLTDANRFMTKSDRIIREIPHDLEHLITLVDDNPSQQAQARKLKAEAMKFLQWQREILEFVRAGRRDEALAQMQAMRGVSRFDPVRAEIDKFLAREERLDLVRTEGLEKTYRHQTWTLSGGVAMALVSVFLLVVIFSRGITDRFVALTDNVGRLAEGKELGQPLQGQDEIAQLDRVFHAMARVIDEKNRENELFIYSVSHDLRSPLVNLQGFSQELGHAAKDLRAIISEPELSEANRARALRLIEDDVHGSLHYIQTAVSRLSAIIDALLRLSRAGRVEYRLQMVDVNATVDQVLGALHNSIAEKRAEVSVARPLPEVWGDSTAVEQIFANLIGNAVNYLDPERPGRIEVGILEDESNRPDHHTFTFKDNGRGIPASGMSKLFLAFQRFHEGAAKGEGIGLALVRRNVERLGGKIWIESEAGVGTTVFVDLPVSAEAAGGVNLRPQGIERNGILA
jgi:signal transduction histidine kinase